MGGEFILKGSITKGSDKVVSPYFENYIVSKIASISFPSLLLA